MTSRARRCRARAALLASAVLLLSPSQGHAHPMGNFSISHYTGIRIEPRAVELRYLVDLAEVPTFQEIQQSGIVAEPGHPSLAPYLASKAAALTRGLSLELNGRPLALEGGAPQILVTPGAGDLPTIKLGVLYRVPLDPAPASAPRQIVYRDRNFPERAGWKEVVATAGPGITLLESSVPERDRSRALADYPTDLLDSPPQVLEATVAFAVGATPPVVAQTAPFGGRGGASGGAGSAPASSPARPIGPDTATRVLPGPAPAPTPPRERMPSPVSPAAVSPQTRARADGHEPPASETRPLALEPNRAAGRRDAFSDLVATRELSAGVLLFAALVAATLGAFHALEPGHGKTVVAAYLVGSRGTARHALLLGLIVTASHTAGVYLLGAVTLYASRYVLPERLYPWLGAGSGLIIAGMGAVLFLRRYAGGATDGHDHSHVHMGHVHGHMAADGHAHEQAHRREQAHQTVRAVPADTRARARLIERAEAAPPGHGHALESFLEHLSSHPHARDRAGAGALAAPRERAERAVLAGVGAATAAPPEWAGAPDAHAPAPLIPRRPGSTSAPLATPPCHTNGTSCHVARTPAPPDQNRPTPDPAAQHRHGGRRGHTHAHGHHHHLPAGGTVPLRQLLALGITGGIVPCPAALVVLLSALALRRVGFGLFLIVAFSVGLAAVLIAIGLLMVYARRLMARVHGDGPLIRRWLPLASSGVITVLGLSIAVQALIASGIIRIHLG